ncbi:MAG: hypothetical protein MUO37_05135 [Methyloceanibacter sp.]|nr:hypothetical protein [Methyloceanibacter sp.]
MQEKRVRPPSYRWKITMHLNASARLPEETVKVKVVATGNYRAMLWGLQRLNGGQRKRLHLAYIDGEPELVT